MTLQRLRLALELRRWRRAGRRARLWWRDDDAREPTAALARLTELSRRHGVPLTLAIIPDREPGRLGPALAHAPLVTAAQHGVDHQNRREGSAAGEFPHGWSRLRLATQLRAGWARLQALPGAAPIYVPPWNDVHPDLPGALSDCGFLGWSAWGDGPAGEGPPRIDAHLDLMRWKRGVRFRGEGRLLRGLAEALAARRRSGDWSRPIGLLTHHLDHDESGWAFLDRFLAWTRESEAFAWSALPELLAEARAGSRAA